LGAPRVINQVSYTVGSAKRMRILVTRSIQFAELSVLLIAFVCQFSITSSTPCWGQGPGGGDGGQGGAPAVEDPKFRDRMWKAGGPRLGGTTGGKLVVGMEIVGNKTVSKHKILSHMQTRVDRNFDDKQLQADLHELYRTELFRKITPTIRDVEGGVIVRLEILEQPTVTEVIFHGNQRVDERMLKKHCGIEVGDPINPFSVDMAKQRLTDLYHEHGMNHASIEVLEGNKAGERRVFFEIAEGPLERIWSIRFQGNVIFSDAILATKIKSHDARGGLTTYMFNKANLNQIREDTDRLVSYYRALGYFQARVDYRLDYFGGGDFLDVTFVVDEGPQFHIRNVSLMGNKAFTTEQLMAALTVKSGDAFNLGKMNRDQRTLRNDYYGRRGFIFVDITPEPRFLEEPGQLDLIFRITEGDIYRAGEVHVHIDGDSSHTQHNVVTNLVGVRPGQIIDLRELEDSERRLKASQLFDTQGQGPRVEVRQPDADLNSFDY
jgi:outer membrane protein insertion porin family